MCINSTGVHKYGVYSQDLKTICANICKGLRPFDIRKKNCLWLVPDLKPPPPDTSTHHYAMMPLPYCMCAPQVLFRHIQYVSSIFSVQYIFSTKSRVL